MEGASAAISPRLSMIVRLNQTVVDRKTRLHGKNVIMIVHLES
jgi:hypothetical protein